MLNPYDQVPYASYAYPQTHPRRLATIATLLGLKPPAVERCRVLEIGCGQGGNLIPMAEQLPAGQFVGFDLAPTAIAQAQQDVRDLGLANARFSQQDIMQVGADLGEFDYIIAHGIYSWVPAPVRDKLLAIVKAHLAPAGIGYVSYNTYPGWHVRGLLRDLLLFKLRHVTGEAERVRQARAVAQTLVPTVPVETAYGQALRQQLEKVATSSDSIIAHDLLEATNDPVYFHQFVQHAAAYGLDYLGEAEFGSMIHTLLPPAARNTARADAEQMLEAEQLADFLRERTLRFALLVHGGQKAEWTGITERIQAMHFASSAKPEGPVDNLVSNQPIKFRTRDSVANANEPLFKAALLHLSRVWPSYVPFVELLRAAGALLPASHAKFYPASPAGRQLLETFVLAYAAKTVDVLATPPALTTTVSERPLASRYARVEAQRGDTVTNLHHQSLRVNELDRQLLRRLDGRHDRASLLTELATAVTTQNITVPIKGVTTRLTDPSPDALDPLITATLQRLADRALLIA